MKVFGKSLPALPIWTVPIAYLIVSVAAYGLTISSLGFYWDDLPSIWFYHTWGSDVFPFIFASDRPFLGVLFSWTTRMFGESAVAWQIFALFTRWLLTVAFWFAGRTIWKDHPVQVSMAGFLFAVYPGFTQQWIALTYSHIFLSASAFLFSIALMLYAREKPRFRVPLNALALGLAGFSLFTAEYFAALELLRPVFLWMKAAREQLKCAEKLKRTLLGWAPYLALVVLFFAWRFLLHRFPRAQMTVFGELAADPLHTVASLVQKMIQDLLLVTAGAWSMPFHIETWFDFTNTLNRTALLLVLTGLLVIPLFLLSIDKRRNGEYPSGAWYGGAIPVGLLSVFLGGVPSWGMNLPIHLTFPADRFALATAFGTSLLLAGLIDWLARAPWKKFLVVGLLVGLAAGYQYQAAEPYRREWDALRTFFWELYWRAPGLTPDTILLADGLPFTRYTDNSMAAPLNWIFAENTPSSPDARRRMHFMLFDLSMRQTTAKNLTSGGNSLSADYRGVLFEGNSTDSLLVSWERPACVEVLDPRYDRERYSLPAGLFKSIDLSSPDRILAEGTAAPTDLLGVEPQHTWCYYFQKASLARGSGDWEEIVRLTDEARAMGYLPMLTAAHAHEYLPFIEGLARAGYQSKAVNYSRNALTQSSGVLLPSVCRLWRRIQKDGPDTRLSMADIEHALHALNCSETH